MENKDAKFRLLGFDISYSDQKKPLSVLRLLSVINADSIINQKAVVLNFVLDPVSQSIKNLSNKQTVFSFDFYDTDVKGDQVELQTD